MSRQEIDIGVQGNDGTGDSIRESFRKVNENFNEIYAIFGAGGAIGLTNLGDAQELRYIDGEGYVADYGQNRVIISKTDGSGLAAKTLFAGEGISIDVTDPDKVTITNSLSTTASDPAPRLGGPLNSNQFPIGKVPDPSQDLVNAFNAVHGPRGTTTTIDELAISKGFADRNYVRSQGGVIGDALRVRNEPLVPQILDADYDPLLNSNYVSSEALPRKNVVFRGGDTMTGPLLLNDHPGAIAGIGTPNGGDDLQAATKYYVDNSTYSSAINLYVTTKGDDTQALSPRGKEGRFWNYAYRSIGAAALAAEGLISIAQTEPGPYRQRLAYTQGPDQTFSVVTGVTLAGGNSGDTGYVNAFDLLRANKEFIQYEVIAYINNKYVNVFTFDKAKCSRDVGYMIDAVMYDLVLDTTFNSVLAGTKYYDQSSSKVLADQLIQTVDGIKFVRDSILNFAYSNPNLSSYIGSVIDAICFDLIIQSNYRTILAALKYPAASTGIDVEQMIGVLTNLKSAILTIAAVTAAPAAVESVSDNINLIISIIQGTKDPVPTLPSITGTTKGARSDARELLINNVEFIQAEIIARLQTEFPGLQYSQETCKRDVRLIVFAIIYDVLYGNGTTGVNVASVYAGQQYWNGVTRQIANAELAATLDSVDYINELAQAIVQNQTPTVVYQTTKKQYRNQTYSRVGGSGTDAVATRTRISELVTIVQNLVSANTPPTIVDIDVTAGGGTSSVLRAARTGILGNANANRTILRNAAITYVNANYPIITDPAALVKINSCFQIIIDMLEIGLSARPEIIYNDPENISLGYDSARELMLANIPFLQAEIIGWVETNYPSFVFNPTTCQRDLKYIIESVAYDVTYGGNYASVFSGEQYWFGAVSQVTGQITQTVEAISYIQNIIAQIIANVAVTTSYQPTPFLVPQVIDLDFADGTEANSKINTLFTNIKDLISTESLTIDTVYPDLTGYAEGLQAIRLTVLEEKTTIQDNTIKYLDVTYKGGFNYDEAICFRDVGYIIEAMAIDLVTGGTYQGINAGKSYYRNTSAKSIAIGTQYKETLDGINYAKEIATQVLNQTTATRYQTLYTQTINISGVLPSAVYGMIGNRGAPSQPAIDDFVVNMNTLIGIIVNGFGAAPTATFGTGLWTIRFTNGGNGYVDQGNPANNDILPAKVLVGITSAAFANIVTYNAGLSNTSDSITARLTKPGYYQIGEQLEFGESVKDLQIVIFVEAGIYTEDYPIKLPTNCSIKGDEFRRTIVRPKDRISQSPWRKVLFYRDAIIDAMELGPIDTATDYAPDTTISISATSGTMVATLGTGQAPSSFIGKVLVIPGTGALPGKAIVDSVSGNFMNCSVIYPFDISGLRQSGDWNLYGTVSYGRHYLVDPLDVNSLPKNNKEMDIFLCNDATRISNMSFQGHGGFAMVLDPEGQVLTKSPYGQVCSSFSQSINRKRFAGGQYIDGFAGRLRGSITAVADNGRTLTITGAVNSGLDVRAPQPPCAFFVSGARYQINDIVSYNANTRTVVMTMDNATPWNGGFNYDKVKCERDVGLIIDSVTYDLVTGSNFQAVNAGRSYLRSYSSLVRGNVQLNKTVEAVVEAKNQVLATIPGNAAAQALIEDRMAIVAGILANAESSIPGLDYDQAKCQRDVGYVLDAVCYDLMFGSNFRTVKAAMAYFRANASEAVGPQKQALIAAMGYLKQVVAGYIPGGASTTNTLIDIIITVIKGGLGSVPSVTLTDPTGYNASYLVGYGDARTLLVANRAFLIAEMTAWINVQKAGNISPFTSGYSYTVAQCEQDVGYIVDAIQYDLTYGGNLETLVAARAYFVGAASQLGSSEKAATLATYTYLKSIIDNIVTASAITKSSGNAATQNTATTAGSAASATFAQARVQDIYDAIFNDGILPSTITPSTSWVSGTLTGYNTTVQNAKGTIEDLITGYLNINFSVLFDYPTPSWQTTYYANARDILMANRSYIQKEIVSWISANYNVAQIPNYSVSICYRDVGYVVDALIYDLMYGGNSMTQDSGLAYFRGATSYIAGEETVTIAAYNRMKTVLQQILVNTDVTESVGNTYSQITSLPASSAGVATAIGALVDILTDILAGGTTTTPYTTPSNFTGVSSLLTGARTTILAAKASVAAGIIVFLSEGLGTVLNIEMGGNKTMLANDFAMINDLGYGIVANNGGGTEQVSTFSYYCHTHYWASNGGQIRSVAGSNSHGTYGLRATGYDVTELPDEVNLADNMIQVARVFKQGLFVNEMTPTVAKQSLAVYITDYDYGPQNISELEVDHTLAGSGITRYEVNAVERTAVTVNGVNILKLNLSTAGNNGTSSVGLVTALYDGQLVTIRTLQNNKYLGIANVNPTRPSTALQYTDDLASIYRVITYNLTEGTGELLPANQAVLSTDTSFSYYKPVVDPAKISQTDPIEPSKTMGLNVGDTRIAILAFSKQNIIDQINKGIFITGWNGRIHNVNSYTPTPDTVFATYNPTGSSGTTLKVSSTAGMHVGMEVSGNGFVSGQLIASITNSTTLVLDGAPDSTPGANLSFISARPPYLTIEDTPVYNIGGIGTVIPGMTYRSIADSTLVTTKLITFNTPWQLTQQSVDSFVNVAGNANTLYNGPKQVTNVVSETLVTVASTASLDVGMIVTGATITGNCNLTEIVSLTQFKVTPAIYLPAGSSVTATKVATLGSVTVVNGGSGYLTPPVITISGGGATIDALVTCTISGGSIDTVTVVNPGYNYTSLPNLQVEVAGDNNAVLVPVLTAASSTSVTATAGVNTSTMTLAYKTDPNTSGTISATTVTTNFITMSSVANLYVGNTIVFTGISFGNLVTGTTYYIAAISGSQIKVATTYANAIAGTFFALTTASGAMTFLANSFNFGTPITATGFGSKTAGSGTTYSVVLNFGSTTAPTTGKYYQIVGNTNPIYNGLYLCTASSTTSITLTYPYDPGTWSSATTTTITKEVTSSTNVASGIGRPFNNIDATTIRLGYAAGAQGQVTTRISTCRATGHDFLDIGTGGYSTTNYPYQIYGNPAITRKPENETYEEGVGRVFYVTTDQNGIFRVGRFFTVDQGTGTVTFSASIALSNLDGIGFKRGVVVSEFSTDASFTNNAPDAVPVQSATRGYIDKRLGLDHGGGPISASNLVGPGYLALNGALAMKGNINANNFKLINLAPPTDINDAVSKIYVDAQIKLYDQVTELLDVEVFTPVSGDIAAFVGGSKSMISATPAGDMSATLTNAVPTTLAVAITSLLAGAVTTITVANASSFGAGPGYVKVGNEIFFYSSTNYGANRLDGVQRLSTTTDTKFGISTGNVAATHTTGTSVVDLLNAQVNFQINPGVIVNADVNTAAAIVQSKLSMTLADVSASAPTGTAAQKQAASGLASFDSANFEMTDGWVGIKAGGVARTEMANIGNGSILANFTGTATYPREESAQTLLDAGFNLKFTTGVGAMVYAGTNTSASILAISTDGTNSTLVKYGTAGEIDTKQLKVDGYKIIDTGSNAVDLFTPAGFKYLSAIGSSAGTAIASGFGTWDISGGTLKATTITTGAAATAGTITGQYAVQSSSQIDFSLGTLRSTTLTTGAASTAGTLVGNWALGASSQLDATAGTLKSYTLTAGTAATTGTITGAWSLATTSSITLGTGSIDARTGTLYSTTLNAGAAGTAGNIVGNWGINGSLAATYGADLAEYYSADKEYEVGTVLVFGGDAEVTTTTTISDTRLAGVISTNPAYIMNDQLQGPRALIALAGRVPCKVLGRIKKGDMLTTSGTPGVAVRAHDPKLGSIIGKALEDKDTGEISVIEIAIGKV
jgi:hypothetical protein